MVDHTSRFVHTPFVECYVEIFMEFYVDFLLSFLSRFFFHFCVKIAPKDSRRPLNTDHMFNKITRNAGEKVINEISL